MLTGTAEKLSQKGGPTVCPAAFIVRKDLILIGLRHYTPDKFKKIDLWTTPGGRSEPDETIEQTLRRETAEEAGITDMTIEDYLGDVAGAKAGDTVPIFICRSAQEPRLMEPDKFSEWRWSRIEDVPANFINPEALVMVKDSGSLGG